MNLFPGNPIADSSLRSMDLFPHFADSSTKMFDGAEKPKTAQMTIFYGGQVIVFNDFPADKAKEVMLLATKGTNSQVFTPQPNLAPKITKEQIEPKQLAVPPSSTMSTNPIQGGLHQRPDEPLASDLPIARRNSLYRFLEKRKDRVTSKLPYPVAATSVSSHPPPEKKQPWLSLAASK